MKTYNVNIKVSNIPEDDYDEMVAYIMLELENNYHNMMNGLKFKLGVGQEDDPNE